MKRVFIPAKVRGDVFDLYPWAAVIAKVDGGYWVFESADDYRMWLDQQ